MMDKFITLILCYYLSFVVGIIIGWWLKTFHLYCGRVAKKYRESLKEKRKINENNNSG